MQTTTGPYVQAKDITIPALGLGTYKLKGSECRDMVKEAIDAGYRHIDTAQIYENEESVGVGIEKAATDRGDIFLTTKVWFESYQPSKLKDSVSTSLKKLKTDYVDLLLLHWPVFEGDMRPTIEALLKEKEQGRAKAVGVSNFTRSQLETALEIAGDDLVTNQVEFHPFLDQSKMRNLLTQKSMALTAYSPLAQGKVFENDVLSQIAQEKNVNVAQVTLAWLIGQKQVVAIPKSSSLKHALSNFEAAQLELSPEERARIDEMGSDDGRLVDPSFAPDWD